MLDPERAEAIARFRAALEDSGYLRPEAAQALGVAFGSEPRRIDLPLYLRRLDDTSALHTLIRLFALHVPVAEAEARAALEPLDLGEACALGLVDWHGGQVVPRVGFVVTDGLVLARDVPEAGTQGLRGDHVVGLNPPAMLLARLTVRTRVGSALDVGCGGGVQSLLAARHAARVIGVDKNPRAVAFARFNARLNQVANVEFREGSLFEPVTGERFDLIVCNPPYVVSPETSLLFRDGGRQGDAFCEEVVRGAAAHLAPNGFATAIVNWVAPDGEPWSRPLERWTSGHGCDAWLLRLETSDTLTYAASWNRQPDAALYAAALDRWLAYYDEHGIHAIGMGAVVLRKRASGAAWTSAVDLPARPRSDASQAILQAFAAQDRLSELRGREALLAARFSASDALRLTQVASVSDGRFVPESTGLRLSGSLPFEGTADAGALRLLQLADGRRTLGEIVAAMGNAQTEDGGRLAASVLETASRLVTFGFLVPAVEQGEGRSDASTNERKPAPDAAAPGGLGRGRPGRARRRPPSVGAR